MNSIDKVITMFIRLSVLVNSASYFETAVFAAVRADFLNIKNDDPVRDSGKENFPVSFQQQRINNCPVCFCRTVSEDLFFAGFPKSRKIRC